MNQELTQFAIQLSATRRGARLARLLAVEELRSWGVPLEAPAHVIAELAANAALHGHLLGRDFRLTLAVVGDDVLRIEVIDPRGDRLPAPVREPAEGESGRGLLLVEALADRWGVIQGPAPCKTVWAEIDLPTRSRQPRPGGPRPGDPRRVVL